MARRYQRLTVELSRAGEDRLVADPPSGFLGIEVVEERPEGRRLLVWLDAGLATWAVGIRLSIRCAESTREHFKLC